ncbi:MAG: TonB-dependent receptor [Pseudomonadota bacterium]
MIRITWFRSKTAFFILTLITLLFTGLGVKLANAQSAIDELEEMQVNISESSLEDALVSVSEVFGQTIIVKNALVKDKKAPAISKKQNIEQAISALLEGTNLVSKLSDRGVYVITERRDDDTTTPNKTNTEEVNEVEKDNVEVISIVGTREYLYRAETTDVFGFDAPLGELPATVNVVTREFLEDTAAYDIEDILNYVPGVVNGGFNGGTNATAVLRGFSNSAVFFNGLRQFRDLRQSPSLDTIERIGIVKGPAGADFGAADAGGTIIFNTKKPKEKFEAELYGAAGNYGFRSLRADVTGPIFDDKSIRYRFISAYSERAEWRDGRPDETPRWTIAPSIAWNYSPKGSLLFEYQRTFSDEPLDAGIFYMEGAEFENNDNFSPRTSSINNVNDFQEITSERYEIALDHNLNQVWSVKLHAQRQTEDIDNVQLAFANSFVAYDSDRLTWDGETTDVTYGVRDRQTDNTVDNFAATLRGDFITNSIEHTLRFGYQYSEGEFDVDRSGNGGPGRRTALNLVNIFDPDNTQQPVFGPRDDALRFVRSQQIKRVFGQWSADINQRVRFIVGLSHDDAEFPSQSTSVTNGPGTLTVNVSDEISYRVSGSYDLTTDITAFVGYSDSYTPQSGTTASLDPIDPLHNIGFEAGLKFNLFSEEALLTTSIYQTTRDNIAAVDPLDIDFRIPFGEVRILGFETELAGSVNENIDLTAGLTLQDSEVTRAKNPDDEGKEFANVPDLQASLFVNYRLAEFGLPRLAARVGVIYIAERQGSPINNFQLPAYTRLDLGARFAISDKTELDIFVENLFDEDYIEQSGVNRTPFQSIIPGDRRLLNISVRRTF